MKDRYKKLNIHMIANLILLLSGFIIVMLLAHRENYARQMQMVDQYISELSGRTSQHISDVFTDKKDAIVSIAYLYGKSLGESDVNLGNLAALEKTSGFDWIRFVDKNGEDYTSDGKIANVADRDYFLDGIKGNSGIINVAKSRVSGERLVGFYAPVYRGYTICGIMVGFLNEQTVSDILDTELYGYAADTALLDVNGSVLGRYEDDDTLDMQNVNEFMQYVKKKDQSALWNSIANKTKNSFQFTGNRGDSVGYIVPVQGTEWVLLQIFPSEATRDIVDKVNNDELFVMLLFVLLLLWFAGQLVYTIKRKKLYENEEENRNRVATLLQSVSDDYICLIDVNLNTEQEEQFRIFDGGKLEDWTQGNYDYSHCIKNYAELFIVKKDRKRFIEATRLSVLRDVLSKQKDFYIEYDAMIENEKRRLQGKFTISRNDPDEEHMLVGIRDITEITKESVKHKTSMDLIVSAASSVYPFILEENLTKNQARTIYNDGIVNWDDMEVTSCNVVLEKLKDIVVVKEDYEKLVSVMSRNSQIEAYKQGKRELTLQLRQLGSDGNLHWMEIKNILMKNITKDIFSISMTRCIDDEIQATLELERTRDAAEAANRAKSIFLFNMSHDIRTPMNAIMGFSSMAEKYREDPEKVSDCIKKIQVSGEHLLKLINDVLDMARIESGKTELDIQAHHIPTAIKNAECIFLADVKKKNQNFKVEYEVTDEIAFYDLLRVNQIELNLISNAIKYTPEGGSILYSVKQIASENGKGTYQCTVRDTGIGMSKEFCSHIFTAFEREHSNVVTGIEGSGLGLAITKQLIEQMHGTISCQSEPGKGTEFVFTLTFPIGTESDLKDETAQKIHPYEFAGKRVLLAEDNELNREISNEILKDEGFVIENAEDGAVALEMVKQAEPGYYDLILMDVQMPKMNGYEATRAIRALGGAYSSIPIIAVTANAFDEDKRTAREAGMNGHISKPIRIEELREEVLKSI